MNAQLKVVAYWVSSLALALTLSAPTFAQDKPKVLAENNKVVVTEANPLAVGATITPAAPQGPLFVRYYLSGGTLEYTYADGTKENITRKAGTAVIISSTDKRPTSVKNIGKTALRSIVVNVK